MNLLSTILDRLNQRIEVGNIFDQIYGLSELVGEGNDKAWAFYIGNGQAIPVTNYDAKQGTLFWAKRGKITVTKNDSLRLAGCKSIYETRFTLTAYAMVRKSHLPCDSADAQDWVASRVLRLISGTDPQFKTAIGVIAYEVVPSGYATEARYLPVNYEWAAVAIDVDVNISTSSEDGCYDTCATGDIPLPDFEPCEPCLTSVAVDGITIVGNGTPSDPLIAVGGGGGGSLTVRDEGTIVASGVVNMNFRGVAVNANSTTPGSVNVDVQEVQLTAGTGISVSGTYPSITITNTSPSSGGTVTAVTGTAPIASSGGTTPDISITQADTTTDGYLSSADWNTFDGKFDTPTGTALDYLDGTGAPTLFPTLTNGTVTSVGTTGLISGGPITTSGTITTSMNTAKLVGRYSAGTGIMEEITVGSGLTLTGAGVLNNTATPTPTGYYGAFQDNTTQTAVSANTAYAVKLNTTDLTNGVSVVNDGSGNPTRITLANTGIYNIQFSLQLEKTGGSGNFTVDVWVRKNGVDIPNTTGKVVLTGSANASPVVAAWNYVLDLAANDYVQLMWSTSNNNSIILAAVATPPHPGIPSAILTVTQQAGIMAGTGITAINSLTGAAQSLVVGTGGTDFAVTSSGTTHTFNLPTASASNRGALSSGDWTLFNGKFNTPSGTTSQYVRGDGTLATFPTVPLIYKDLNNQTAVTGNTNNNKVVSVLIPANTITVGNIIEIKARAGKTGSAGIATLRVYANTADSIVSPAPTLLTTTALISIATNYIGIDRTAIVKSATITQTAQANSSIPTDAAVGTASLTNSNIDWTVNQYLIFALQNGAAGDSTVLSYYQIEIK